MMNNRNAVAIKLILRIDILIIFDRQFLYCR